MSKPYPKRGGDCQYEDCMWNSDYICKRPRDFRCELDTPKTDDPKEQAFEQEWKDHCEANLSEYNKGQLEKQRKLAVEIFKENTMPLSSCSTCGTTDDVYTLKINNLVLGGCVQVRLCKEHILMLEMDICEKFNV